MLSDAHLCDFQEPLSQTYASRKIQVIPVCNGRSESANKQDIKANEGTSTPMSDLLHETPSESDRAQTAGGPHPVTRTGPSD